MNIMIEGLPHASIKAPMDRARNSCAINMEILRKETAVPFVSLACSQGRERSVPESYRGERGRERESKRVCTCKMYSRINISY